MTTRARPAAVPAIRDGLLTRLARNKAGNTIMLTAFALLPLTAMIGSGVDMARIYMVKSRLQQACDAGVLAGRKYMTGTTLDATATARAQAFFGNNFPTAVPATTPATYKFGTTNLVFTPTRTDDGQVQGTASVRVPMAVMQVFGNTHVDLNVTCQARLEVANTDVMMVLDVTGSMLCLPSENSCTNTAEKTGSKIIGLRAAVLDFYDTISQATSTDSRFRIGFVPYSAAVNMGIDPFTNNQLLDNAWMVDNWTYQSRVANMTKPGWTPSTSYTDWQPQTYGSNISNANCTKYGNNQSFTGFNPNPAGNPTVPTNDVFQNGQPATVTQTFYRRKTDAYTGNKPCTREYRTATTTYAQNGRFAFNSWEYRPVQYNVANYRTGAPQEVYTSRTAPTGSVNESKQYNMWELVNTADSTVNGTSTSFEGCVEERQTNAQSTYGTIPSDAWDLDVKTTPSNEPTSWKPMWADLVYDRSGTAWESNSTSNRPAIGQYGDTQPSPWDNEATWCPVAASHLAVRTRSDVEDYVNDLRALGNTYHDLGMAWGLRMITPFGMWAANNATAPNGRPISRHILFMTDGVMVTPPAIYNAHGYEESDRRVSGSANTPNQTDLVNRHNERFQALCNAARASNNITVWTIAFGTANPPTLISCADSGKAFSATNTAQLRAQFQQIAANIAKLRLSQ